MTSISKRANAYRAALRTALNDGLSIKASTDLAKAAAREVSNLPQQKPVILTDAELRLIDENELTAEECDRLDELDQAAVKAAEDALDVTLPKGKSGVIAELAQALGYQVINVELADEDLDGVLTPTPEALREQGRIYFTGADDEAAEFAQVERDTIASLSGYDDGGPYNEDHTYVPGDLLRDILAGDANHKPDEECCDCSDCDTPVRDCDVEATLRAVDIPATEHSNAIKQWFYTHEDMCQFLAGRCLFVTDHTTIKDEEGDVVGMWFYAHFGPTPVS